MHTKSFFVVLRVWEHAQKIEGYDPSIWRKDFAGAWIRRDSYNSQSKYGWTIEKMVPIEYGGKSQVSCVCYRSDIGWKQ